jgi:hypothetical protein
VRSLSNLFGKASASTDTQLSLRLSEFFDDKYMSFAKATKRRSELDRYVFDKHMRAQLGHKKLGDIRSEAVKT